MARPTKYESRFCKIVIDEMSQGLSLGAVAGVIGIDRATLFRWKNENTEFAEAIEFGLVKSELFWEKIGIAGVAGKLDGFNAAAWIFNMKNRFRWRDKIEHSGELMIDNSKEKLKKLLEDPKTKEAALLLAESIASDDSEQS